MKNIFKSISLLVIVTVILVFSGCRKAENSNSSSISQTTSDTEYIISISETGEKTVIDKNGDVVEDAIINEDGSLSINGKIISSQLVKQPDTIADVQKEVSSDTSENTVNKIDTSSKPTVSNPQNSASVPVSNNSNNNNTSTPVNNNSETVVPPAQAEPSTPVQTLTLLTDAEIKDAEDYFFKLVNEERARVGVAPLTRNGTLDKAAKIRVEETKTVEGHTRPNGTNYYTVLTELKYGTPYENIWSDDGINWKTEIAYDYGGSGENLAHGANSQKLNHMDIIFNLFTNLKNSPGHYQNMINPNFTQTGVAFNSFLKDNNTMLANNVVQIFTEK